ncbi:MAG: family 1 encapsulin nanocompartment shell protein [Anaerolineae bacterium]
MSEYLMRGDAPLTDSEWERVDETVVATARQFLVGRRFLDLKGPMGPGVELVPVGTGADREFVRLEVIEESFMLYWQAIEASRKTGLPLETGAAAHAAMACAQAEDRMILNELLDAADKSVELGDWDERGGALTDIVSATEQLFADGFFGPYAVVLSPALYTKTQQMMQGMGRLVRHLVQDVAEGGLFRSPLLEGQQGLVLSLGAYNFDLVVGQDLIAAYQGNEGLDHSFRVLETIALRIKQAGAICKLA